MEAVSLSISNQIVRMAVENSSITGPAWISGIR